MEKIVACHFNGICKLPTIWYNKFVTYTYSDAARTHRLTGPTTEIYESLNPM